MGGWRRRREHTKDFVYEIRFLCYLQDAAFVQEHYCNCKKLREVLA